MFAVEVRDHMMIAHSLPREVFGPAQAMHGATFLVDAAFITKDLDENGLAVDIGLATLVLKDVLAQLNYRNLDELETFRGKVTTTEVLAKYVFDCLRTRIAEGELGTGGSRIARLKITLHESHVARAWYEAEV